MRAVVLGLVGVVLAGQAWAGECPAGTVTMRDGGRALRVLEEARVEEKLEFSKAERSLMLVRMRGRLYTIDMQKSPGSSLIVGSAPGRISDDGPMAPRQWHKARPSHETYTIQVDGGPLSGSWEYTC
jgi:hypothetical protein